ncbi:MAG: hypothetical protein ACI8TX_002862 [Hyphomicrobiaceae bacterium]|jgi:hypothetical protein
MAWPKYTEEQIRYILMLGQTGIRPVELCQRFVVPVVVINVWQSQYGTELGRFDEARILRLEREVTSLRKEIADLSVEHRPPNVDS